MRLKVLSIEMDLSWGVVEILAKYLVPHPVRALQNFPAPL
jgi:hypothetical protein